MYTTKTCTQFCTVVYIIGFCDFASRIYPGLSGLLHWQWTILDWLSASETTLKDMGKYYSEWRHNKRDGVSNHRRLDCLRGRLFRHRSKKIAKLCVTGLCERNPPVTGGSPSQRASNAENVSTWWRHHDSPVPKHNWVWTMCIFRRTYYVSAESQSRSQSGVKLAIKWN